MRAPTTPAGAERKKSKNKGKHPMSYYLAPSLVLLRDEVNQRWPKRSKRSDGWIGDASHSARKSDHNPDWSAPGKRRGVVRALDITTTSLSKSDIALLRKHTTNDARVAYVIHQGRIYTHARGWYRYNGPNPHNNHLHVSLRHTAAAENQTHLWFGSAGGSTPKKKSTGTSSTPKTKRVQINRDMETNKRGVELRSHRRSNDDKVLTATLGSAGWDLHVLYREGSWARVQRNGQQWVAWDDLREIKGAWPETALKRTGKHTTASDRAWRKLLGDVDYNNQNLTVNFQNWLKDQGYYKGRVDGKFLAYTVEALQRFLKDRGFYKGLIDAHRQPYNVARGPMLINAEIDYLNSQRKYY